MNIIISNHNFACARVTVKRNRVTHSQLNLQNAASLVICIIVMCLFRSYVMKKYQFVPTRTSIVITKVGAYRKGKLTKTPLNEDY